MKRILKRCTAALLTLALLVILPGSVAGEIVYLRNGKSVQGQIMKQTRESVTVRTAEGIQTIPKSKIRRIVFTSDEDLKKKAEEERKAALQKKAEEDRKAALRKAELRKAALLKKAEEDRKAALLKKEEEDRKAALLKKEEEDRKAALLKKEEEDRKAALLKKEEEDRKAALLKKEEEDRKVALLKKEEEDRKAALQKKEERPTDGAATGIVWRSALLPGWGQLHRGSSIKGAVLGGAFLGLAGYASASSNALAAARAEYDDPTYPLLIMAFIPQSATYINTAHYAEKRAAVQSARKRLNISLGLLGLLWGYNIYDAWFTNAGSAGLLPRDAAMSGARAPGFRLELAFTPRTLAENGARENAYYVNINYNF